MKWRLLVILLLCCVILPQAYAGFGDVLKTVSKTVETVDENQDLIQAFTIDDSQEMSLGSSLHPQILEELGGEFSDKTVQAYVDNLGQKLAKLGKRPNLTYVFTVTDSEMVNAFALPGGYVYVTKTMLYLMEDEAELASVLGHEIAHVTERHGVDKMRQMAIAQRAVEKADSKIYDASSTYESYALLSKLTEYFAGLTLTGYGRKQELQSDRVGIKLMNKAGYDPRAAIAMFERLKMLEGTAKKGVLKQLHSSHPPTDKRIVLANSEIKKMKKKKTKLGKTRNAEAYAKIVARLGID